MGSEKSKVELWVSNERQATTEALKQQVLHLQADVTKLQQLVSQPVEHWEDISTLTSWTQGHVTQRVSTVGSLLSRQWTLYQIQVLSAGPGGEEADKDDQQ